MSLEVFYIGGILRGFVRFAGKAPAKGFLFKQSFKMFKVLSLKTPERVVFLFDMFLLLLSAGIKYFCSKNKTNAKCFFFFFYRIYFLEVIK